MPVHNMTVGNQLPALVAVLTSGGRPVDLTNASGVTLTLTNVQTGAKPVSGAAVAITTPASGLVTYSWGSSDCNTAGTYRAQFKATFPAGTESFPNGETYTLFVVITSAV